MADAVDAEGVTDEVPVEFDGLDEDPATEEVEGDDVTEGVDDLDPEDTSDEPLYTVKWKSEEKQVPLEELIALAQMGEDYTRKTQALAADRDAAATYKALQKALDTDFESTVEFLREQFAPDSVDIESMDPLEREVRELKSRLARQEQTERDRAIQSELAAVKQTYNDPDLDEGELLAFAVEHRLPSLDVAYKAMAWDRRPATSEQRQRKVAAKRSAPAVAGGERRPTKTVSSGASDKLSLRDSLLEAIKEHGPIRL
jgi:hypothetical protein